MFQCERCGTSYSSDHAVGIENCPRCMLRDRTMARLSFKVFDLPKKEISGLGGRSYDQVERPRVAH